MVIWIPNDLQTEPNFSKWGSQLESLDLTRPILPILDHYLSISKGFKYCLSWVNNPNLAFYSTLNKGRISSYFWIAILGRVICRSLNWTTTCSVFRWNLFLDPNCINVLCFIFQKSFLSDDHFAHIEGIKEESTLMLRNFYKVHYK